MDKVKVKILFVCTGNTCRSPMAEFMFKEYLKEKKCGGNFSVSSAGLYAERGAVLSDGADKALEALGVKHTMRKARMLTVQMCNDADVIIAVTNEHARACGEGAYSVYRQTRSRPVRRLSARLFGLRRANAFRIRRNLRRLRRRIR